MALNFKIKSNKLKLTLKITIMNSNAKTILGIMAAGAVGVAIGMLLAPQKGSDIRLSMKDKMDDIQDTLYDLVDSGKEFVKSSADKFNDVKDEITSKASDLKNEAKGEANKYKSSMS